MVDKQRITIVENIYREHKDHIYNYIHRMCNDSELSHDIVQATFIKILSDPKIADVEHHKAYLFTVARNNLFDEMKRKKPVYFEDSEQLQDVVGVDEDISLHDQTEEQILAKVIDKAITNLPEKFRELMLLRYTEDLSIQEIAVITDRKLSDIKVNLHRARLAFENRFTATMYSKVAASRKRCDTLIGMIATYGDNDIPMVEIPKIEMHIANCASCNEDATEMKRRRELFALLPILIAPGLWDDIMKEAQASTQAQDASTQHTGAQDTDTHGGKHTTTGNTATSAFNTAAKTSAVKLASIAAVVMGVVVGGIILSQLITIKDIKPPAILPEQVNATPPSPLTPAPTGTKPSNPSVASSPLPQQDMTSNKTSQSTPADPAQPLTAQPPQQIAKAAPLEMVPQTTTTREKTKQDKPIESKPQEDKPRTDESNGKWLYNGPPITATVEEKLDQESETEASVIYLSKYGMWSKSMNKLNKDLISIANFTKRKGWVLQPSHKVYMDIQLDDKGDSKLFPPPITAKHMDNIYDRKPCREFEVSKKLGMDTIDGKSVEKWGCMLARTEQTTIQWYDPDMQLVIAEENNEIGKTIVRNIKNWKIDKSKYEIPDGYKEVAANEFFALTNQSGSNAVAQESPFETIASFTLCNSGCVDQMNECTVKMKPQCQNAEDKSACYEPCNAAYSACLGTCPPPPFNQMTMDPEPE